MAELGFETPLGPSVTVAGREMDYFSGAGYLGLQKHPDVQADAIEAIRRYGMATATSRGGYGEHILYDELEAEAGRFFDSPAVLTYPSGYFSALILAHGLRERYERAFVDESSHYSVFDGLRAAGKPITAFHHLDASSLREGLRRELGPGERPLLFSDGLFPISGEIAPLPDYLAVLGEYEGGLLGLDDAHAAGVLGPNGRGTLEHHGIQAENCLAGATLSKALGGYGGLLPGSREQIAEVQRNARAYGGASPIPLPSAAASCAALRIARTQPELRERLRANIRRLRLGLGELGWNLEDSPAPILCLRARPGLDLAQIRAGLFARGVSIAHVTSYSSTPPGGALRIAVFASHSPEQIDRLLAEMKQIL